MSVKPLPTCNTKVNGKQYYDASGIEGVGKQVNGGIKMIISGILGVIFCILTVIAATSNGFKNIITIVLCLLTSLLTGSGIYNYIVAKKVSDAYDPNCIPNDIF